MKIAMLAFCLFILPISDLFMQQKDLPKLTGRYFNQTPPVNVPEIFGQGIVSTSNHEHSPLIFSSDGNEIIWSVIPVPFGSGKQKILYIYQDKGEWTEPILFSFSTTTRCGSPVLSPDDKFLYYMEQDPNAPEDAQPKPQILWRVERNSNFGWSETERVNKLLPKVKNKITMSFGFADNGNLYYDLGGRQNDNSEEWDIWMREYYNGEYSEPIKLGNGINDGEWNWTLFIAPDESYLIWSSNRMNSEDYGDLYVSFKITDNQWTKPIALGKEINTSQMERFPSVSPDGKYFFFTRNTLENRGDFFWVDAKFIEEVSARITEK